jgi:hypothetical protein
VTEQYPALSCLREIGVPAQAPPGDSRRDLARLS